MTLSYRLGTGTTPDQIQTIVDQIRFDVLSTFDDLGSDDFTVQHTNCTDGFVRISVVFDDDHVGDIGTRRNTIVTASQGGGFTGGKVVGPGFTATVTGTDGSTSTTPAEAITTGNVANSVVLVYDLGPNVTDSQLRAIVYGIRSTVLLTFDDLTGGDFSVEYTVGTEWSVTFSIIVDDGHVGDIDTRRSKIIGVTTKARCPDGLLHNFEQPMMAKKGLVRNLLYTVNEPRVESCAETCWSSQPPCHSFSYEQYSGRCNIYATLKGVQPANNPANRWLHYKLDSGACQTSSTTSSMTPAQTTATNATDIRQNDLIASTATTEAVRSIALNVCQRYVAIGHCTETSVFFLYMQQHCKEYCGPKDFTAVATVTVEQTSRTTLSKGSIATRGSAAASGVASTIAILPSTSVDYTTTKLSNSSASTPKSVSSTHVSTKTEGTSALSTAAATAVVLNGKTSTLATTAKTNVVASITPHTTAKPTSTASSHSQTSPTTNVVDQQAVPRTEQEPIKIAPNISYNNTSSMTTSSATKQEQSSSMPEFAAKHTLTSAQPDRTTTMVSSNDERFVSKLYTKSLPSTTVSTQSSTSSQESACVTTLPTIIAGTATKLGGQSNSATGLITVINMADGNMMLSETSKKIRVLIMTPPADLPVFLLFNLQIKRTEVIHKKLAVTQPTLMLDIDVFCHLNIDPGKILISYGKISALMYTVPWFTKHPSWKTRLVGSRMKFTMVYGTSSYRSTISNHASSKRPDLSSSPSQENISSTGHPQRHFGVSATVTTTQRVECNSAVDAQFCSNLQNSTACKLRNELGSFIQLHCPHLCGMCTTTSATTEKAKSLKPELRSEASVATMLANAFEAKASDLQNKPPLLSSAAQKNVKKLVNDRIIVLAASSALIEKQFANQITQEIIVLQSLLEGSLTEFVTGRCGAATARMPWHAIRFDSLPIGCASVLTAMVTLSQSHQSFKFPDNNSSYSDGAAVLSATSTPLTASTDIWNVSASDKAFDLEPSDKRSSFQYLVIPVIVAFVSLGLCVLLVMRRYKLAHNSSSNQHDSKKRHGIKLQISENNAQHNTELPGRVDRNLSQIKKTRLNMKPSLGIEWDHSSDYSIPLRKPGLVYSRFTRLLLLTSSLARNIHTIVVGQTQRHTRLVRNLTK